MSADRRTPRALINRERIDETASFQTRLHAYDNMILSEIARASGISRAGVSNHDPVKLNFPGECFDRFICESLH